LGSKFVVIPRIGPLIIGGLTGRIEGAVVMGGIGTFGVALVSLRIPQHKIIKYETEIRAGKCGLFVQSRRIQLEQVRQILEKHIPKETISR